MMACHIVYKGLIKRSMLGLAALALFLLPSSLYGQRVAWVVGNSDYADGILPNPVNDARLVSDSLSSLGFEVQLDLNLKTSKEFGDAAREVLSGIASAEVFLFYYAGHGIQVDDENYLIPTEAEPQDEAAVNRECFAVKEVINLYQRVYRDIPFVAVLDACRVNPFERKWSRSYGSGKGLSKMSAPTGSLIAYSTEYGTTAADGNKKYSDYAVAFAQAIGQPGLSIQEAFQEVRRLVLEASNDVQVPVEQNKLTAQLVLRQLPDVSEVQLGMILGDFEVLLRQGFHENALLIEDTLIGVNRKIEVVRHYAKDLDTCNLALAKQWAHLELFYCLYHLQRSRGINDEKHLSQLSRLINRERNLIEDHPRQIAKDFESVLRAELDSNFIDLDELESLKIEDGRLKFSAGLQLESDSLPELILHSSSPGSSYEELIDSFIQTEYLLTFEELSSDEKFDDATKSWSTSSVVAALDYHRTCMLHMSDAQNVSYSSSCQLNALTALLDANRQIRQRHKELKRYLEGILDDLIGDIFCVELDIKKKVQVANQIQVSLMCINYLLETDEINLSFERKQELLAFYTREVEKTLGSCAGVYFELLFEGKSLVNNGFTELQDILPSDEVFARSIIDFWECFVLQYLQNEESHNLDELLNHFLEESWGFGTFENSDISFETWTQLSEKHMSLLRLTNKISNGSFSLTASRLAMPQNEVNSHQMLDFAQEFWSQVGSASQEIFETFGREDYGFVLGGLNQLLLYIELEQLRCDELIELDVILREAMSTYFDAYDDMLDSKKSFYNDILSASYLPDFIQFYRELVEIVSRNGCDFGDFAEGKESDEPLTVFTDILMNDLKGSKYVESENELKGFIMEAVGYEAFEELVDYLCTRFRLLHKGKLNTEGTEEFLAELFDKNQEFEDSDVDALFEYAIIIHLYELIEEASLDIHLGTDQDERSDENIKIALGYLRELVESGQDKFNRRAAVEYLVYSLQTYFLHSERRSDGSIEIIETAKKALKRFDKRDEAYARLTYILAEELACTGLIEESLLLWSELLADSVNWEMEDLNQFAQNRFLDMVELEGPTDNAYLRLFEACSVEELGFSIEKPTLEVSETGVVLSVRTPKRQAYPIVEFTSGMDEHLVVLQLPNRQWRVYELSAPLGAITTPRDASYNQCLDYQFSQVDVSDESAGVQNVVYSNEEVRDGTASWSILLNNVDVNWEGLSHCRSGFYWGGLTPTGHTQDLKYLTFLSSASIE